jgi:hypothetical protein
VILVIDSEGNSYPTGGCTTRRFSDSHASGYGEQELLVINPGGDKTYRIMQAPEVTSGMKDVRDRISEALKESVKTGRPSVIDLREGAGSDPGFREKSPERKRLGHNFQSGNS